MSDPSSPPTPVGPYRPSVRAGEWIVCSGQLGIAAGQLVDGGVVPELRQAIEDLKAVLAAEGATLSDVVKTTIFLTDMGAFDEMNATYIEAFSEIRPARTAIGVTALPRGGSVEIEAWARNVRRVRRSFVAPLVATAGLLGSTACIGLHHTPITTTTIVKSPPHLVAIVTLIGTGSNAGTGTTVEAIDLSATPVTMRQITVGQFPDAVAIAPDGKTAYVTSYDDNTITPINLTTGKAEKAIDVGTGPAGIAIAPSGKIAYVTEAGTSPIGNTVTPVNLAKHKALTPITVGAGPQGIAITPDGSMAYVANAGAIVSGQSGSIGNTVTPITLKTGTAGSAITVGNAPVGVAVSGDGSTVYVTNANSDSVSTITAASSTAGVPVPVNGSPQAVATAGTTAWVADTSSAVAGGNNLSSIASGAIQVGTTVTLSGGPSSVAIAPGGATGWVVSSTNDKLIPVDLATGKVVPGTITLPAGPYAVALAEIPATSAARLTTVPVKKTAKKAASS